MMSSKLRGIVGQKKIGHTGTLGSRCGRGSSGMPGKATKACELLTDKDKTYRAVLFLGQTMIPGFVLETSDISNLNEAQVTEYKSFARYCIQLSRWVVRNFMNLRVKGKQ